MIELELNIELLNVHAIDQKISFLISIDPLDYNISYDLRSGDIVVLFGRYYSVRGRIYSKDICVQRYLAHTDALAERYDFYNLLEMFKTHFDFLAFASVNHEPHRFYKIYKTFQKLSGFDVQKMDNNEDVMRRLTVFLSAIGMVEPDKIVGEYLDDQSSVDFLKFFDDIDELASSSLTFDEACFDRVSGLYNSLM